MPKNPLDYLLKKPEPIFGPPSITTEDFDRLQREAQAKLPPGKRLAIKGLEAVGDFGRGLTLSDPNMPREELDKTSWPERVGMLAATAPIGGTGIKGLFSRVNRAIENFPGKQINANRALSLLKNQASAEEIDYRGLGEFLRGQQGKTVPTEAVKEFAQKHPLGVKVKTYGEGPFPVKNASGDVIAEYSSQEELNEALDNLQVSGGHVTTPRTTRHDRYTLPGGENYRETIIQLQPKNAGKFGVWDGQNNLVGVFDDKAEASSVAGEARDRVFALIDVSDPASFDEGYRSHHWPDPNPLAHVRHNERNLPSEHPWQSKHPATQPLGPKGRFLEEVQSDWHEAGRDRGYRTPEAEAQLEAASQEALAAFDAVGERAKQFLRDKGFLQYDNYMTRELINPLRYHSDHYPEAGQLWHELEQAKERLQETDAKWNAARNLVPAAPFKTDWPDLVLKQQLMDVVERPDLDWLGFTTGQTQIDRYDLSQVANRIHYDPQQRVLEVLDNEGSHVATYAVEKPEELIPLIGKDAADRLMRNPIYGTYETEGAANVPVYELAGEELQVGGRGMTQFYDEVLPAKLGKILQPFGGKVEKGVLQHPQRVIHRRPGVGLPSDDEVTQANTVEMWYAKLSPEMKAAIREKGLPLLMALLAAEFGEDYYFDGD